MSTGTPRRETTETAGKGAAAKETTWTATSSEKPAPDSSADQDAQHRVEVYAARLRVTLDNRLGRETPESVVALAKEPA